MVGTLPVQLANTLNFKQFKPIIINKLNMVEAAGVEPASEIEDSRERLHAQSRSGDFSLRAQNGQNTRNPSP